MYCQKNQFLITGQSATDATNTPTSRVLLNTRGGGVLRICSVRDAKDVLGVEMLHFGIFLGRKSLANIFLCILMYVDILGGYLQQSEDLCYTRAPGGVVPRTM